MKLNVRDAGFQCPTCGVPVDVVEPVGYAADYDSAFVRAEPCLHEWEFSTAVR